MEGVAGATNKELRVSDGRETVSAPEEATNKEQRLSEARKRRGCEMVSAPGNRERSERN